jgi:IS1 family transposase
LHFPPQTKEVQFDEKWAFVRKKRKHCDDDVPDDSRQGDNWDHVAYDPEHRLVVSVIPGKRTAKNIEKLVVDFKKRTGGRFMNLITSDEYKPYKRAILKAYGKKITPPHTGKHGRPIGSRRVPADGLKYAAVHKTRRKGRVVKIDLRVIFGSEAQVKAAIETSSVSNTINTAFVERHNGTDRNRNARKVRKSYCFSKDWDVHNAI